MIYDVASVHVRRCNLNESLSLSLAGRTRAILSWTPTVDLLRRRCTCSVKKKKEKIRLVKRFLPRGNARKFAYARAKHTPRVIAGDFFYTSVKTPFYEYECAILHTRARASILSRNMESNVTVTLPAAAPPWRNFAES